MRFTLASIAAFIAISSAMDVQDPKMRVGPDGQIMPMDLNGAQITWMNAQHPKVNLYLANFMDDKHPPECINIAMNVDASLGHYTIPAGSIKCAVSGGTGYQFRVSYTDNCCGFDGQNMNSFPVAAYTPSSPMKCNMHHCA